MIKSIVYQKDWYPSPLHPIVFRDTVFTFPNLISNLYMLSSVLQYAHIVVGQIFE